MMLGTFLFFGYAASAIGAVGVIELSLIGSRFNHPAVVIGLATVWPVTLTGMLAVDLVRALRK